MENEDVENNENESTEELKSNHETVSNLSNSNLNSKPKQKRRFSWTPARRAAFEKCVAARKKSVHDKSHCTSNSSKDSEEKNAIVDAGEKKDGKVSSKKQTSKMSKNPESDSEDMKYSSSSESEEDSSVSSNSSTSSEEKYQRRIRKKKNKVVKKIIYHKPSRRNNHHLKKQVKKEIHRAMTQWKQEIQQTEQANDEMDYSEETYTSPYIFV